jgi:putative acetyltransferase
MNPAPITIRRATTQDAAAFARIMGDPDVLPNLLQVPYTSEEIWKARLGELLAPGKADLMLVAERDRQVLGTAGLHPAGPMLRRRHVMMLGISVAREAQGQGIGRALMQALCDFADNWGQVLRLELQVFTDNTRAVALYKSLGFVPEGVHRGHSMRDGVYVDSMSMARFHPQPPRIDLGAEA